MQDMRPEDAGLYGNPPPTALRPSARYGTAFAASQLLPPLRGAAPIDYELSSNVPPRDPHSSQMAELHDDGSALGLHSYHSYPSLKRAYESYNDVSPSDAASVADDGQQDVEAAPILSDHRLLFFGPFKMRHTVMDQYGRTGSFEVTAQLHGMFFFSDTASADSENAAAQPELTCYRRNLFQISGSVTSPTGPLSILLSNGEAIPIGTLGLSVSALDSIDGNAVRLIVIPWKTPPPNAPENMSNQEQEPAPIPIFRQGEYSKGNGELVVEPIAWRRLQFRTATANNGRRKELQQHFLLRMTVDATLANGTKVSLGECATVPIVVRGRSPRNFQTRKEIPLVASSAMARGQASQSSPVERRTVSDSSKNPGTKPPGPGIPSSPFEIEPGNFHQTSFVLRQGYGQQQSPTLHSAPRTGMVANVGPNQASMDVSSYLYNVPQLPDGHPGGSSIPSPLGTPQTENSMRGPFYRSNTAPSPAMSHQQTDYSRRPSKSPRHTYVSTAVYPPFEGQPSGYDTNGEPIREYFPPIVPSQMWTTAEQGGPVYSTAIPPPPATSYTYPPGPYAKGESPPTHYMWNS